MEIYIITNQVNDKKYVGQTIRTTEIRWKQHLKVAQRLPRNTDMLITRAIRKYGPENFTLEIFKLHEGASQDLLNQMEQLAIVKYNSLVPNGYNQTTGGRQSGHPSDETRKNMSAAQNREEVKLKKSLARKGCTLSKEHKKKISIGGLIAQNRPAVREANSASQLIAQNRPEVQAKRSAALLITFARPEVKARQSASAIIAGARPEVKAKRSAVQLIAQNRPEVKIKKSTAQKNAQNSPEARAKNSAAQLIAQNRPEVKAKKSASAIIANARPEVKVKQSASNLIAQNRPETQAKRSLSLKKAWARRKAALVS